MYIWILSEVIYLENFVWRQIRHRFIKQKEEKNSEVRKENRVIIIYFALVNRNVYFSVRHTQPQTHAQRKTYTKRYATYYTIVYIYAYLQSCVCVYIYANNVCIFCVRMCTYMNI